MQKLIQNDWRYKSGSPFARAQILRHEIHPEGLDVDRIRFFEDGLLIPEASVGHIISVLQGSGRLHLMGGKRQSYQLEVGTHLYLPPGFESVLEAKSGSDFIRVSSPSASQARGKKLLLRHEMFLAACASDSQSLRWTLTPQYLSRRAFLHHDPVLLSKSGEPVSWFHTTMFDVAGLPQNEEGLPVFKMSYNSRTEVNFCYDVKGDARVRMAQHPYRNAKQLWGPWSTLNSDSTYHLNEAMGSPEEERYIDETTQTVCTFRNKHEVSIVDGYVSLFCLFDPAPTGIERHRPGEYSDYEPLSQILDTKPYKTFTREIAKYDEMVEQLSLARAMGTLAEFCETPTWELFIEGQKAQAAIEAKLIRELRSEGNGRELILACWMQSETVQKASKSIDFSHTRA